MILIQTLKTFSKTLSELILKKTQNNANKPIKRYEIVDQASNNTQKSDSRESAPLPTIEKTQNNANKPIKRATK